jgi:hypothetical protein
MRVPSLRSPAARRVSRRLGGAVAALLGAATLTLTAPASPAAAATSCLGGAQDVRWEYYYTPHLGPFTTSPRCRDINFRSVTNSTVTVCVVFTRYGNECNYQTRVGTAWKTIATDVRDGTRFYVRVIETPYQGSDPYYRAKVAF